MSLGWFRRVLAVGAGLAVALTGGVVSQAHASTIVPSAVVLPAAVTSVEHPRFLSFTPSVGRVSENDPYVVLEARLDGHTPSGQHMAIYDVHARTLIPGHARGTRARRRYGQPSWSPRRMRPTSSPTATSRGRHPCGTAGDSRAVHVTNVGWVPPVSVVSFVASVTQVSENAPYSYLRITWDHTLPSGFYTAVYDDTGALAFSCSTAAYCDSRVRPADGAARTYKAYVVQGSPAAAGWAGQPVGEL